MKAIRHAALGFFLAVSVAWPREAVISPAGPTLAEAIASASDGDRIVVRPGRYAASGVVVDKALVIEGEPGAVLDGEGRGTILVVTTNGVTVRGLALRDTGISYTQDRAAIRVENAAGGLFENNVIENAAYGVHLAHAAGCVVRSNTISAAFKDQVSAGNGIHAWYCRDLTIEGNRASGQRDGIYLEFVSDGRIVGNRCEGNLRYGLHFMFSDRCVYEENVFRRNGAGVAVMYSRNVAMRRNRFERSWGSAAYGLLFKDITDSAAEDNLFLQNSIGLHAEGSSRLELRRNRWDRNGWAVRIMGNCVDCVFTGNVFTANAFDVTTNSRSNPNRFEGNHWRAYRGYDLDRDGVGDVPHHPVRLFAMLVEQNPPALILLRSPFVALLDVMESVAPAITPETLVDTSPLMRGPP